MLLPDRHRSGLRETRDSYIAPAVLCLPCMLYPTHSRIQREAKKISLNVGFVANFFLYILDFALNYYCFSVDWPIFLFFKYVFANLNNNIIIKTELVLG